MTAVFGGNATVNGENGAKMKLNMTIDEALEFSDEWIRGVTLHEGSQGWRVVCMLLAEEVRRLRDAGSEAADILRQEATILRDCHTLDGKWDEEDRETQAHYEQTLALADRLEPPDLTPNALANAPARTGD